MSQSRIFSDSTDGHDSIAKEPEEENSIAEAEARKNRRTGDSSVYKYYIRSAGLLSPAVFITTMAILAFCDSFPSRSSYSSPGLRPMLMEYSKHCGSSGGHKPTPQILILTWVNGSVCMWLWLSGA